MLLSKLRSGTSKTKAGPGGLVQDALLGKSHCATCSLACVILYHMTRTCKGPIQTNKQTTKYLLNDIIFQVFLFVLFTFFLIFYFSIIVIKVIIMKLINDLCLLKDWPTKTSIAICRPAQL